MSPNVFPTPPLQLAERTRALSRSIFRSLPWGYRLARLCTVLAADAATTLGRTAYAIFIASAVRQMPPVDGRDALDLVSEIRGPEDTHKLPADYGRVFGSRLFRSLLAKFGPEIADEAVAETLLKMVRGKLRIRNGANLSEAEGLVSTVAINHARDQVRREQRRRRHEQDNDERTINVEDPEAFVEVERALSPAEMQLVLKELERVHPRARSFAESLLDGDTQSEIAQEWQVTPSYVSKWFRQHRDEFAQVLNRHLREARARYSYDRRTP